MSDNLFLHIQRQMAWERAKGELQSILVTYYGEAPKFKDMNKEISKFIETVEDEGLAE